MKRPTNTALKIAGIALALSCMGGALTGCGGSDGAPAAAASSDAASTSAPAATDSPSASSAPKAGAGGEFCAKFNALYGDVLQGDPDGTVQRINEWATEMADLGAPKQMDDDQRDGFETMVSAFKSVQKVEDIGSLGKEMSAKQNEGIDAFGSWTSKNCPQVTAPTSSPSEG